MRTMKPHLFALFLIACDASSTPDPIDAPRVQPAATADEQPSMPVGHTDTVGLGIQSRGPRRLSVTQLEKTLERIADFPPGSIVIPQNLALTMGEPDYLRVTEESLDPSPLYMKFMVDLGSYYCLGVADADLNPQQPRLPANRLMNRVDGDLDAGLRHMLLMFTGIEGDDAATYIERLRRAYDTGAAGAKGPRGGWEAACLALFTAPEFILY